jgi:Tfp pilus assembly protein PilO
MKLDLTKIIESFNNLTDQARYGILGGAALLIIVLDVFFLVLPQIGSIADTNDQIKKMSDDTQQVLSDKQRISLIKKNLQASRDQLKALSAKVRRIQEVPVILSTISGIAKEHGVKIDQLVPEYNHLEVLNPSPEGKYFALPVLIKARCGYHNFGHFLNKVENGDLSYVMKDFIIQNDDKSPNIHLFSLTIKIILVE